MKLNNDGTTEQITTAMFSPRDYMKEAFELVEQINTAYEADRYVDIDGNVWLGRGDERWYMEGKGHLEDPAYWLTDAQMRKKMINELSGEEQYRRDNAARIEALYEYAAQRSSIANPGMTHIVGDYWGDRKDREEFVKDMRESETRYKYALVRRRKAGPVEVVDA